MSSPALETKATASHPTGGSATTVAVIGTSGYTGQELQRLIAGHPDLGAPVLLSAREGSAPDGVAPYEPDALHQAEIVFLCTPHGFAQPLVQDALERGCRVVDLSADFRLRDPAVYAAAYGAEHAAPDLLPRAVYGLTEHVRAELPHADLVANPGCYPTSVLLPLVPLATAGLVDTSATVVCDSKSGVSGAGNTPTAANVFGAVHDNFRAYAAAGHRHAPEIRQESGLEDIVFVPHLLPVFRGILSTLYLRPARGVTVADMREHLRACWEGEPFVHLMDEAEGQPQLADVRMTNRCRVAIVAQGGHAVITSVIDNLTKGAAGQAIQNMNLMLGYPETAGLA